MRHILRSICLPCASMFISFIAWTAAAEQHGWDYEKVFGRNKEAPCTTSLVYSTDPQVRYTANRTDVRWFTVTDHEGHGVRVTSGGTPLCFATWPYSLQDLEQATHDYQLPRRDTIVLNIDHLLHGVGDDNSWGALTHPQYTLPADQPYEYTFTLSPVP